MLKTLFLTNLRLPVAKLLNLRFIGIKLILIYTLNFLLF